MWLVNVARASLDELLLDYEDYLRHRRFEQWAPASPEAMAVRSVPLKYKDQTDQSDLTDLSDQERGALYAPWLDHDDPAIRANALIWLINQANYLLDKQIAALEAAFIEEGGYNEQLATARLQNRNEKRSGPIPDCPDCGKTMVLRTAKSGKNSGKQFWGCSVYPECKGIEKV